MKSNILKIILISLFFSSCFSDEVKQQMAEGMKHGQEIFADRDFKMAIGCIELHKLRYGDYPESLNQLKFINEMDSSIFNNVQYFKLDSGYELNLISKYISFKGESIETIKLKYPDEFWQGLGCKRSNLKTIKVL